MWRKLTPWAGATLFVVAAWVLTRELNAIGFQTLSTSLSSIPPAAIAGSIALTILNYVVLAVNDGLAVAYVSGTAPMSQVALASFVGYAVSNNIGFALVTGASARHRFYSRFGIGAGDLSRIVAFYSATFWIGMLLVGGLSLTIAPPTGLPLTSALARTLGLGAMLLVVAYVVLCVRYRTPLQVGRFTIAMPRPRLMLAQLSIGVFDWLLAASAFYLLLPAPKPAFLLVLGGFAASQLIAIASHVPGGLGVFEGLMLLWLGGDVPADSLAPALLLFRVVYYLLPLAVALVALLVDEALLRRAQVSRWSRTGHSAMTWAAPRLLALLTFASGAMLLFSGATPGVPARLAWLERIVPLPLLEASHFTGSLTGLGLLLLARAIALRVDAAFYVTAAALTVGAVASLLKGADYEEAMLLTLVLAALVGSRRYFTRRARLFDTPLSTGWLIAVGTVVAASIWLGFFAYQHITYRNDLWWHFAVRANAPRFLRASVAVVILALAVAIRQLLRPARPPRPSLDGPDARDIEPVIALQPRSNAYLVYLGDKSLLWNDARTAFLMYGVQGRSAIALGDPVGAPDAARDLVRRFLETCRDMALTPVFYEASPARLADFADFGLTALKIGEDARVRLDTFSLAGSAHKHLRNTLSRADREGFIFRVVMPHDSGPLMPELQEVSDEWLAEKGVAEKAFSLGSFKESYVRRFPIAVIERHGRIEAFANLWPGPGRVELSPDLMRYRATAPAGVMDMLFARLMLWAKAQGYEWFDIGMAPLSGLAPAPLGGAWSRLGHFVYRHGEAFYNFRGLRAYKEKFNPEWEPRYLAYPGGLALARTLRDVTAIIAGGYTRILLRPGARVA